jgi:phosphomannomutase
VTLKIGISGLRGTVSRHEESLSAATIVRWTQAFVGRLQAEGDPPPVVALGHDARRSSTALADLARGALLVAGATVFDLGLTLTPVVQFAVRRDERLGGGIMITASHNPARWNGLKFLDGSGLFVPLTWWEDMRGSITAGTLPAVPLDEIEQVEHAGERVWQAYLQSIIAALPVEEIRRHRYRVALDACNGGAARWAELLEALGCEPLLLNSEQHGFFAREAEPLPAHLGALRELVRAARCDLGLAADPDGDRLVLVDSHGSPVSEEHTVVLAAMALARRHGDRVAVNVVTTHALEEALPQATVIRTAVGEMNVVRGALEHDAVLGGEGSGGIIIPKMNLARDGLAASGLVLALMAEREMPLDELVATIPAWSSIKTKLTTTEGSPDALRALFARWAQEAPGLWLKERTLHFGSVDGSLSLSLDDGGALTMVAELPGGDLVRARGDGDSLAPYFQSLAQQHDDLALDLTDGVKVQGAGVWLSLRPSNTEAVVRVMGEVKE